MLDILKQNKIVTLIIIVILVAAAWYGISSSSNNTSALTSQVVADSKADQTVVDELLKLRAIRLEGAIFADPAFESLQDSGVDIVSEPIGRRNPFAPLDGEDPQSERIFSRAGTTTSSRTSPATVPSSQPENASAQGSGRAPSLPHSGEDL